MKLLNALPMIVILGLVAFLSYIGYEIFQDYQQNKDKNAPGTLPGSAPAGSFGSYIDDSLGSIGQSSQDLATAQQTFFTHPIDVLTSIFTPTDDSSSLTPQ
jgi:uncharacterized membrane protein YebE (DUF533 family)